MLQMQVADLNKVCILFHIQNVGIMSLFRKIKESWVW
jgi:hypothetical protein